MCRFSSQSFINMHLKNFPNIRVKKYPKGYAVEIQLKKWWGRKYWTHIVSVSGMSDVPWYYSTQEIAISEATKYFNWDLIINTKNERD